MATIQDIVTDIDLRYRNTFTTAQKIVWMNEQQRELFEIIKLNDTPYSFTTVTSQNLYPIPSDVDIEKIRTVSIQIDDTTTPSFQQLPFIVNDDNQYVNEDDYWYTIFENNFFINVPGGVIGSRRVDVYRFKKPTDILSTSLTIEPDTPIKFQEILKLGVLEKVAGARKDTIMHNNFLQDKELKIQELEISMQFNQPEYSGPIDVLPRRHRRGRYFGA